MPMGLMGLARLNAMRNRAISAGGYDPAYVPRGSSTLPPVEASPGEISSPPAIGGAIPGPELGVQRWSPPSGQGDWQGNAFGNKPWQKNAGVPRFSGMAPDWLANASQYQWGSPGGSDWIANATSNPQSWQANARSNPQSWQSNARGNRGGGIGLRGGIPGLRGISGNSFTGGTGRISFNRVLPNGTTMSTGGGGLAFGNPPVNLQGQRNV